LNPDAPITTEWGGVVACLIDTWLPSEDKFRPNR
jgi:hypothetical protein